MMESSVYLIHSRRVAWDGHIARVGRLEMHTEYLSVNQQEETT